MTRYESISKSSNIALENRKNTHHIIASMKIFEYSVDLTTRNRLRLPQDAKNNKISYKFALSRLDRFLFLLLLMIIASSHLTEAGIIGSIMQHKLKEHSGIAEPLNASSSNVFERFHSQDGRSATISYHQSPLDRIMGLMGHPPPLFVLSSSDTAKSEPSTVLPVASNQAENNGASNQQYWTLLGSTSHQPNSISDNNAANQIYMTSNNMPDSDHQVTVINSHLSPSASYQPQSYYGIPSFGGQPDIMIQPAHQQQIQPQIESKSIFLSAYQPPSMQNKNSLHQSNGSSKLEEPAIDSIHRQTSVPEKQADKPDQQDEEPDEPSKNSTNVSKEQLDRNSLNNESPETENDNEREPESSKAASEANESESDEPAPSPSYSPRRPESADYDTEEPMSNESGSLNYEDKFDNDNMDESSRENPSAQSSSIMFTGLKSVGLNDDCLQCICRASSGCDHQLRCITRGAEEKYCGPFQITEEYWNQSGSPGDASNNFSAFEDCANEAECAVETVTNYMKRHHKDCDGDEQITCMDYARLHRLRPDECGNTDKLVNNFDAYWAKFQRCAEGYNRSRTGDDDYA